MRRRAPPLRRPVVACAAAAVVGVVVSMGCQALPLSEPASAKAQAMPGAPGGEDVAVTGVEGWWTGGRGAVVGPDTVLTVAHVLGGQRDAWVSTSRSGGALVPGRVVDALRALPEPVLVVRVETSKGLLGLLGFAGFSPERRYAPGTGAAAWIDTPRGREPFGAAGLQPGDSGSPVVDGRGGLVGLLCGRRSGVPVFAPVYPADLAPYERRFEPPGPPVPPDLVALAWPAGAPTWRRR